MNTKNITWLMLVLCSLIAISCAQRFHYLAKVDSAKAKELVVDLKENSLLWVYKTNYKKHQHLREMIAAGRDVDRAQKMLDESIAEQQAIFEIYKNSFQEVFEFTKVYYVPDSSYNNDTAPLEYVYDLSGKQVAFGDMNFMGITAIMPTYGEFVINYDNVPVPQPFPSVVEARYFISEDSAIMRFFTLEFFLNGEKINRNATLKLHETLQSFYNTVTMEQ